MTSALDVIIHEVGRAARAAGALDVRAVTSLAAESDLKIGAGGSTVGLAAFIEHARKAKPHLFHPASAEPAARADGDPNDARKMTPAQYKIAVAKLTERPPLRGFDKKALERVMKGRPVSELSADEFRKASAIVCRGGFP